MATTPQLEGTTNVSGRVAISVGLLIGLAIILIFVSWISYRIRRPVIDPTIVSHLHMDEERSQKGRKGYILKSLPVIKYSERVQPNGQERVTMVYDSAPNTYPPRRDASTTIDRRQPRQVDTEPAVITRAEEQKKPTTVKISGTPDSQLRIPLEPDASQVRDRYVSRHEAFGCSVCAEDFVDSDNVRILPCGHLYHRHCIDPWLLDFAMTCPLW